jgi:hypothetical protein
MSLGMVRLLMKTLLFDLTVSRQIGDFNVSLAQFLVPGDDITQGKVSWGSNGWDVALSHALWEDNPTGSALEIGRTWTKDLDSFRVGGYAETGFGFNPSLTANVKYSRDIGHGLSLTAEGCQTFIIDEKFGKDNRGSVVIFSIAKSF